MQGEVLIGVKAQVVGAAARDKSVEELSAEYFNGHTLIGSRIADDSAIALTDFRIQEDGFSRLLLINMNMPEQQTGRVMQRLLELETYRMMALLALPLARKLAPTLDEDEAELAAIGEALLDADSHYEQEWLDRLTRLSASSQARHQRSSYRFAASDAYYEIVLQRISDLCSNKWPVQPSCCRRVSIFRDSSKTSRCWSRWIVAPGYNCGCREPLRGCR
jgi:uncharacterized membrane-anchored protein